MALKNTLKQVMSGPSQVPGFTTPFTEGIRTGQGTMFNLPRGDNLGPAFSFDELLKPFGGVNVPSGSAFQLNFARTASSDPVQNILNNAGIPTGFGSLTGGVSGTPQTSAPPPPTELARLLTSPGDPQFGGFLSNLGGAGGGGFLPPSPGTPGNPGFLSDLGGAGRLRQQMNAPLSRFLFT